MDRTSQKPAADRLQSWRCHATVLLAGALFSGLAMWHVGRLGFQFEDLSIPFDGGYRVWLGQRPYVDFMAPSGLVLYLQQALCFALFGVGLGAYLLHAAAVNAIAGLLVWRLLARRGVLLAAVASLATYCWFFLIPGAPYIDTMAFFWTLVGFSALAAGRGMLSPEAMSASVWKSGALLMLAGLAASLAVLTKQNIGGLAVAGLGLLLVLDIDVRSRRFPGEPPGRGRAWRSVVPFTIGLALPWLLLAFYLGLHEAWPAFRRYTFEVPADSGRLKMLVPWAARMAIKAVKPEAVNSTFAYMLGPALRELAVYGLSGLLAWRWWKESHRRRRFWLASTVVLLLLQQWSYNTSNNNESLYWPFIGLLFGCLVTLFWPAAETPSPASKPRRRHAMILAAGLLLAAAGYGLSASRRVHDLKPAALGPALEHPRLAGLRLYPQEGQDFAELLAFIDRHIPANESFFVLGDASLLYGVSGHRPPAGLLWYRDGVSYLADDNTESDALIRHSLKAPELRWVIVDAIGRERLLTDFPGFSLRLGEDFELRAKIGGYGVYGRERGAER